MGLNALGKRNNFSARKKLSVFLITRSDHETTRAIIIFFAAIITLDTFPAFNVCWEERRLVCELADTSAMSWGIDLWVSLPEFVGATQCTL